MKTKTNLGFTLAIVLAVMFFAWTSPVQADYTITGAVTNAGSYSATGSLWTALTTNGDKVQNPSGPQENGITNDYVEVDGSSGSSFFSVSELSPSYDASSSTANPTLVSDGSGGYNLTSNDGRTVTGVTSIEVVDAFPQGTNGGNNGGVSTSLNITAPGGINKTIASLTPLAAAGALNASGTDQVVINTQKGVSTAYSGPTLSSILQAAGVNTGNLNQMLIFVATDGYSTLLSMGEIVEDSNPILLATLASDGSINVTGNSKTDNGFTRLVLTGETGKGQWVSNLDAIQVETPTPAPAPSPLLLLGFGLAGLVAWRKKVVA